MLIQSLLSRQLWTIKSAEDCQTVAYIAFVYSAVVKNKCTLASLPPQVTYKIWLASVSIAPTTPSLLNAHSSLFFHSSVPLKLLPTISLPRPIPLTIFLPLTITT